MHQPGSVRTPAEDRGLLGPFLDQLNRPLIERAFFIHVLFSEVPYNREVAIYSENIELQGRRNKEGGTVGPL